MPPDQCLATDLVRAHIASDKTGTLTRNEMTVRVVLTAGGRAIFSGTSYVPEGRLSSGCSLN